jgi:hypothetical protein
VESCNGPAGEDTVRITVRKDCRVFVALEKQSNPEFDRAVLKAYRKLDGNRSLAFPAGSSRSEVTFLADSNHLVEGLVSCVTTETCRGDTEQRRGKVSVPPGQQRRLPRHLP